MILTSQEKYVLLFLMGTAIAGSIVGGIRHDIFHITKSSINTSSKLSTLSKQAEQELILSHNNKISENKKSIELKKVAPIVGAAAVTIAAVAASVTTLNAKYTEVVTEKSSETAKIGNKSSLKQKKDTLISSGIININIAGKQELMSLPYIGDVKADRIVQFRNDFGGFKTVGEIIKVKGIGEKTLEKLRPFITVK